MKFFNPHTNVAQFTEWYHGLLVMNDDEVASFPTASQIPSAALPDRSFAHWDAHSLLQYGTGGANGPLFVQNPDVMWDIKQRRRLAERDRLVILYEADGANTENVTIETAGRLLLSFP